MEYNITYRQKDGGWQYIISFKQNGKWKQRSKQGFRTRALAKKAADIRLDELKGQWEVQAEALPEHRGLTFKEFREMYKKHKALHDSASTQEIFGSAIKYFEALDEIEVVDIMPYHIQNCVDNMVKKGLASSTTKLYTTVIKTCLNFAINPYQIREDNPVIGIRMPKDQTVNIEVRALTGLELEDLLSKVTNQRYYIATLLASKCGLRVGEIVGLTWDRVDFNTGKITINRQWKLLEGNVWGFGTVKSLNSNRVVPAPPVVISALKKFKVSEPLHISGRILPYTSTGGFASTLMYYYPTLSYDISIHDLRHTYATTLIANGVDFKTVAKLMGHDVEQTIRTYSHVTSEMMDNATKIINSIL